MAAVLTVSNYLVQVSRGRLDDLGGFYLSLAFLVTDCVNRAADAATGAARGCCWFCFRCAVVLFSLIIISPPAMSPPPILSLSPPALHLLPAPLLPLRNFWMLTIFDRFRRAAWWLPPLASSMPSSLLDTALFSFWLLLYTDVPWLSLAIGDFAVKAAMALLLLPSYRFIVWRLAVS